jgi:hypothetical protein
MWLMPLIEEVSPLSDCLRAADRSVRPVLMSGLCYLWFSMIFRALTALTSFFCH